MKKNDTQSEVDNSQIRSRPALTPEARENQLIALAYDLAEKQLREGTASSQVITEFLKRGSSREKLEQEKLKKDQELVEAKKESLRSTQVAEELYKNALAAMRSYSGTECPEGYDPNDPNNY